VADEVSTGELARRLDSITTLLQKLVSREEYSSDQRHAERRFTEIEADLKDLQRRMDERDKTSSSNVRQAIYAGLLPSALFLITVLLQLKGGQ
jgi:hypothetical protein